MGVVTPLNNPGGPEGDTVTVAGKLLNTEYWGGRPGGARLLPCASQEDVVTADGCASCQAHVC